jgi:glycogen operon protein
MTRDGSPTPLGATVDSAGTNFAVYSSVADRVQLCLFDELGHERQSFDLTRSDNVWHTYLADCRPGQRYGYRVHGPFDPDKGLRCNSSKLLVDPYARALSGKFAWHDAVFDSNDLDSAAYVPKSVVYTPDTPIVTRPEIPWSETVFYEANVRGYTMRHPALDEADRGTFDGMRHGAVLEYLKALGITSIELMPVHAFIDENHLVEKGLRNFWGYNTISFFSPSARLAKSDAAREFRQMLRSIHEAGIEVILDVVYNHTGEGSTHGPTLSFRGLDNLAYYSTEPGLPGTYINDTGCGNTLNADHPQVQDLVIGSLRYWHETMGVDGFRFDLAPVLGRHNHGFSNAHPLLEKITTDRRLRDAKLVAEPWDPGPGGYQLGQFPDRWAEWNDRYRDTVRSFWRGDHGAAAEFAKRLHGSADVFETSGRSPAASVNLVSTHDGFTLNDVVSYEQRHNEANGEDNQDGHSHNLSRNYGVEGVSDDPVITALRRRQRLNMIATLLFSQGTPLLLAGDEFGHTQQGNNNAYAQDNEIGWLDWSNLDDDPQFVDQVRELIRLRRGIPLLRMSDYVHGRRETPDGAIKLAWLRPDGQELTGHDWSEARAFTVVLSERSADGADSAIAVLFNAADEACAFQLPQRDNAGLWTAMFCSTDGANFDNRTATLPGYSLALLARDLNPSVPSART